MHVLLHLLQFGAHITIQLHNHILESIARSTYTTISILMQLCETIFHVCTVITDLEIGELERSFVSKKNELTNNETYRKEGCGAVLLRPEQERRVEGH